MGRGYNFRIMAASNDFDTLPTTPTRTTRALRWLGVALGVVLMLAVGGAVWAGYQSGLQARAGHIRATQAASLRLQADLAAQDAQAGRWALAAERLQFVVDTDPNYPNAQVQLALARSAIQATATAQAVPPTPTFTPAPPTPTSEVVLGDPAAMFAQAQAYFNQRNWNGVIVELAALHAVDSNYQAAQANGLLRTALQQRGIARILGTEMEAGIADITQAGAFGPLEPEALNHRAWARLYLAATSYWGINWQESAAILGQLYVLAPNFKDTAARYREALTAYAAGLAQAGNPCAAEAAYQELLTTFPQSVVGEALAQAQAACAAQATPETAETPTPEP